VSGQDVARLLAEAERWRRRSAGRILTAAAAGQGTLYWVGGVVRDGLLGRGGPDIDLLWDGELGVLADRLRSAGAQDLRLRPAFRTMSLRLEGEFVDLAAPRRDHYPQPGATPEIMPAPDALADLARRDFTANAMLVDVTSPQSPALVDPHDGLSDLRAGLLRPLGPQTLREDPLRLLRGARYLARTGWQPTSDWDAALSIAADPQTWAHVAPGRLWAEHVRIADEADPAAIFGRLAGWGLDRAIWGAALPERWLGWMADWRRRLGPAPAAAGAWLTDLVGLSRLEPTVVGRLPLRWHLHADQWPRVERLLARLDREGGDALVRHARRARGLL
jgi:hypothetical protein